MPKNIITNDPAAQSFLKHQFIRNRWQTPFATDVRMSKDEAHSRAWQAMMLQRRIEIIRRRQMMQRQIMNR